MTTERELLDALHAKLGGEAQGNGGRRWVIAEHVRARAGHAGWDGNTMRTADALAIDTWLSKGMELHGFEMKCSRSDWLTELRCPEKSEPFRQVCDRWWLVVSDRSIVKPGELPEGWGLMSIVTEMRDDWDVLGRAAGPLPEGWDRPRGRARRPFRTLRRVKQAPKMLDREPIPRHMLATMMRSAAVTSERKAG